MRQRGRPPHPDILTPREQEVLALLRDHLTNEQIAERLGITRETAKYHVSEILSKLHVGTREEAARWQPEPELGPPRRWSLARLAAPVLAGGVSLAAVAGLALLVYGTIGSGASLENDTRGDLLQNVGDDEGDVGEPPPFMPDPFGRLVVLSSHEGVDRLYVVDVNEPENLTAQLGSDLVMHGLTGPPGKAYAELSSPRWSPDGSMVAYLAHEPLTGEYGLVTMHADGSNARVLAHLTWSDADPACPGGEPLAWSPGGDRIAAYSVADGLSVVDVGTGDVIEIPGAFGAGVGWSPTGEQLTYVVHRDGACRVGIAPADASEPPTIIAEGHGPAWSPTGSWIAYGRDGELFVVDPHGGNGRKVLPWDDGHSTEGGPQPMTPRWSPDSQRIVVYTKGKTNVLDITPEGCLGGSGENCHSGGLMMENPHWGPDSNWYVGVDDEPGEKRVFIAPRNNSGTPRGFGGQILVAIGSDFDWTR